MSHGDPRYARINAIQWPAISRQEATEAAKRLFRRFGKASDAPVGLRLFDLPAEAMLTRRCWISSKETSGASKGWPRLIHDVSHRIYRYRHPSSRPHGGGHATLERELAEFVIDSKWHEGILKPAPKPVLSTTAKRSIKLNRIESGISRWEAKMRRAQNALKKLKRQKGALIRAMNKGEP